MKRFDYFATAALATLATIFTFFMLIEGITTTEQLVAMTTCALIASGLWLAILGVTPHKLASAVSTFAASTFAASMSAKPTRNKNEANLIMVQHKLWNARTHLMVAFLGQLDEDPEVEAHNINHHTAGNIALDMARAVEDQYSEQAEDPVNNLCGCATCLTEALYIVAEGITDGTIDATGDNTNVVSFNRDH